MQPFPSLSLSNLPRSAKIVLTLFLLIIGSGYLMAVGNMFHQQQLADGKPGLTPDDLKVTFHGVVVEKQVSSKVVPATPKSRMLEMVEVGGEMRKHLNNGGLPAIRSLQTWLNAGAVKDAFQQKSIAEDGDPSADDVIAQYCLRCHNAEEGEKSDTPYGADIFETDYEMVYKYAAPGTASDTPPDTGEAGDTDDSPRLVKKGPQAIPHLFLVSHIHMLSIPVFALIVAGLFLLSDMPTRLRGFIAPLPMLAMVMDFSSWWLARISEVFLPVIMLAGALFGISFAVQIFTVLVSLWRSPKRGD